MHVAIYTKYLHLFLTFAKISLFSFGGGNGMLEVLRYNTVELRGWLTIEEFNLITGVSVVLPGLNALNIACIIGYKVAGIAGAVISIFAISIPSLIVVVTFYGIMSKFLSLQTIKSFENILQYAVIVLIANIIYNTAANLVLQHHISFILIILSVGLFVALAILKLDTILCLFVFIVMALLLNRL